MVRHRVERLESSDDLRLYINNSLQFDTRDEHIYHETLFLPPVALARTRSKENVQGLILGGGDGLGLRETLKFPAVKRVDLVDYDPGIVDFAKNTLTGINQSAFHDPRVQVHIEEASQFLLRGEDTFDFIVADFTFPEDLATCALFTRDFFSRVSRRLNRRGIFAVNACSPTESPEAFWSIYRTLTRVRWHLKPIHLHIPSFCSHGYGDWGFLLGSPLPVTREELRSLILPEKLKFLTPRILEDVMTFSQSLVVHGMSFSRVIEQPEDLRALLHSSGIFSSLGGENIHFAQDHLPREVWKYFNDHPEYIYFSMSSYWKKRVLDVIENLDWQIILDSLNRETTHISKEALQNCRAVFDFLSSQAGSIKPGSEAFQRAFVALMMTVILMNMLCPDNAYAKGYHGTHHYHSSSNNQYSGDEINFQLVSAAGLTPFHNRYWLNSQDIPDMTGKAYPRPFFFTSASSSRTDKSSRGFFALSDQTFLTESGELHQRIPATHSFFKIEDDGLELFLVGRERSLLLLAVDDELFSELQQLINVHQKALDKSIPQFEKWLNWTGVAGLVVGEISYEEKELEKLKLMRKMLSTLQKRLYVSSVLVPLAEPSFRLAPSLRLTLRGEIVVQTRSEGWQSVRFESFVVSGNYPELIPDSDLSIFLRELLTTAAAGLKPRDPLKNLIMNKLDGHRYEVSSPDVL